MVKIDLITGFLGSGKTTFIKKYARYLMNKGERICILENDYGAVNVDMLLMNELRGENCELEMVAGGCDADCHKRRFKTKLISMAMSGYDRVIVEPSGIFDVDEFFDTLCEEPLDQWYETGNVITVVDACLEEELSQQSDFMLASQVAVAGRILFSHLDEAGEQEQKDTSAHIKRALNLIQSKASFEEKVLAKKWEDLTEADFERLSSCGYSHPDYVKLPIKAEKGEDKEGEFQSLYFMNHKMSEQAFRKLAEELLKDQKCGRIFRIKGFMQVESDKWILLNATKKEIRTEPIKKGQDVFIVIGEGLAEARIKAVLGREGEKN